MGDSRASQEGRLMTDPQGCVPTFQVNLQPDMDREPRSMAARSAASM